MAAAIAVRPLRAGDIEPLRWVIYRAYLEILVRLYGPEATAGYEVRSPEFMELYVRRDPAGCFVADAADGSPAGAVFCFVWGEVGWFGSLAVAPEWQGHGIGQALTGEALAYLRAQRCRRIGLETWPQSALVRHLYGKFGFRQTRSTVKFSRPVPVAPAGTDPPEPAGGVEVTWVGQAPRREEGLATALDAVDTITLAQAVASAGEPRVDYRDEVAVPVAAGWAELVVARTPDGAPQGFALCYLRRPGGGPVAALDVRLLGVGPGAPALTFDRLIAACDARARSAGVPSVTVDVNLRHGAAATLLRERRFRPVYELMRMERALSGFDPAARTPLIDCARWAG